MSVDPRRIQAVFLAAVEQADPAGRAAVLDHECGTDAELRRRVEALLRAEDPLGPPLRWLLDTSATAAEAVEQALDDHDDLLLPAADAPTDETTLIAPGLTGDGASGEAAGHPAPRANGEGPGARIGPYKLLQEIGEGGMGSVYMAEQQEPVRRMVALKIIKPGMDSRQVIARFEAERQALALMDHPNIARVLDAGTTGSGRPFFVMELVHGVPITEYCDEAQLTPRQRLELFVPVCQAIQHAHQKGVIHRDIKPSNVLVTLYDGRPVPKVIDFGVAKAIDQRLTERTMFTEYGTIVGTLEYMSPEQAEMSALGVDTRSDIYSLGVLLYELLTGSTPLERARLWNAGYAEILKRIREEDPPKPSTRLSSSRERLVMLSAQRKTEPGKLSRLMRGELDWIVMRALEKDRSRRYETANGLARDLQRFLQGEAVEACPPSASYRLRKFARRHRAALATASALMALLAAGAALSTWQAIRATAAEGRAKDKTHRAREAEGRSLRERDRALAAEARAKAEGEKAVRSAAEARAVLTFFEDQVLAAARPAGQEGGLGRDATIRAAVDAAEPKIAAAFPGQPNVEASVRHTLGTTYHYLGEPSRAIRQLEAALALRTAKLGPDHPDTLAAQNDLALAHRDDGRLDLAIPMLERTLEARAARLGPDHPSTLATRNNLALAYQDNGRLDRAIPLLEQTVAARTTRLGADHPDTLATQNGLAVAYQDNGRLDRAIPLFERTRAAQVARLGADHPSTLSTQKNLANAYKAAGRWDFAIPLLEETLAVETTKLGPDHPSTLATQNNLALAFRDAGRWDRAIPLLERTLAAQAARLGDDHPSVLLTRNNLALAYRDDGQFDRAIPLFERTLAARASRLGADHPDTLLTQHNLAMAYREAGRWDRAIPLFERTLATQKARMGADHPYTLLTQNNLAPAYQAVGQTARAIALLEQTLALRSSKLGPEHPSTLSTQNNLALAYQAAGQLDRAIALFERTLAARLAKHGDDHPRTLTTQHDLACAYDARGEAGRAESMLRAVLAARKKKLGAGHPEVAQTLSALGRNLLGQRKWAEAEPPLREALAIWEARRPDDWSRPDTQSSLGESLFGQGRFAEAEPPLLAGYEGLKAREATLAAQAKGRLAEAGERIVRLYTARGRPEKASEWRETLGLGPGFPADPFQKASSREGP
jgi:serine/threonine protein kinase/lipopolysaccharide biosynthesis regulator YciM